MSPSPVDEADVQVAAFATKRRAARGILQLRIPPALDPRLWVSDRKDHRVPAIRWARPRRRPTNWQSRSANDRASWKCRKWTPPPPALGGITIEAVQQRGTEKRPGIDIPLQSAPLGLRIVAALVDGMISVGGFGTFRLYFLESGRCPPAPGPNSGCSQPQSLACSGRLTSICSSSTPGNTPGLRLAGLELARFDGTATTRSLRRWRVLAAYLSAVSLGMGYVWVFLDEDSLCWHDRITHTYLAPKSAQPPIRHRPYKRRQPANAFLPRLCYLQWLSRNHSFRHSYEAWPQPLKVQSRQ